MSETSITTAAADADRPAPDVWRAEIDETIRLSVPIALTQLGQVAMFTTDLMLIGRLGDHYVAATALAHTVLFAAFTLGMGLVAAVAPLAAQAFGARQPRMVRRALRVGLWAAVIAGVPLTAFQLWSSDILILLGQPADTAALAGRYAMGLAWSLIPAWAFMAVRGFMGAINRPQPALWITLAAIPLNLLLAYALIFGAFGLPRLDVLGAGVATTLVNIAMCAAVVWVACAQHPFRKYQILGRFWRPDWALMRELLKIGVPISATYALEFGVFAAAALLMGQISTTALAAHQVALQTASILFMVPFGISMAATVRVGHAAGRRDPDATRRAGYAALALGAVFMAAMTLAVVLSRGLIPLAFLGTSSANAATVALVSALLLAGATFFIADGLQTVAIGALRGLNDTRVPLIFATISFWLIGFTACWLLGFRFGLGAVGVWLGLSLGLLVYAVLLVLRFDRLTRSGYLPEVVAR